ncbi:MAG: histidine phosphatase family protein [Parafilimonas sp.]
MCNNNVIVAEKIYMHDGTSKYFYRVAYLLITRIFIFLETRSLLIIRHAKSSWEDFSQKDFDRPLNDRGKKNAPIMAKRIHKEMSVTLDAIISSPAKRAFATAKFFAKEFNIKKENFFEKPELYEPSIENFFKVAAGIDDDYKTVALFSHNPGISVFANLLTNIRIDDMPTCAVFAIHIQTDSWKNFRNAEKEFWFFDYPKNIM